MRMPLPPQVVFAFQARWSARYGVTLTDEEARDAVEAWVAFVRFVVTGRTVPPPTILSNDRALSSVDKST